MTKLFVTNIHYRVVESDLLNLFGRAGYITGVKLVRDRWGRSKGFAFIDMGDRETAERAIDMLDQSDFRGRLIRVYFARKRGEDGEEGYTENIGIDRSVGTDQQG